MKKNDGILYKIRLKSKKVKVSVMEAKESKSLLIYDLGFGYIINTRKEGFFNEYQIAITEGNFDTHRDDLGCLWVIFPNLTEK